MTLECTNRGGRASLLAFATVPRLEQSCLLDPLALPALVSWQARLGDVLSVVAPDGSWYRARLVELTETQAQLVPFEALPCSPESPLEITLLHALPDKERFELVLEKATELGAVRIVPFHSHHSISLAEREARQPKSHRWPDLLVRAARQCRRGIVPELYPVVSWDAALYLAGRSDMKLMLYERDRQWGFGEALRGERPHRVAVMVGPEGGFSEDEVVQARAVGVVPTGLGCRILRTETAAIAALTLTQYVLGDLW